MRILFWLGLVVLIVLALKKKMQPPGAGTSTGSTDKPGHPESPASPQNSGTRNAAPAETMVCCAHCQIYLPASEAVQRDERVYCSQEHADLA
ncbi:MAG: PP0621 family protein [Pseudomonadota bacterium]